MKRVVFVLAVLTLFLSACSPPREIVEVNGWTVYVDFAQGQIRHRDDVYHFTIDGPRENYRFTVTFPDGSRFSRTIRQGGGSWSSDNSPGWPGDMFGDHPRYLPFNTLHRAVSNQRRGGSGSFGRILLGLVVIGVGMLVTAFPEGAWYLTHGWRFQNAEPSDAALIFERFGGIVTVIVGIVMIVSGVG